MITAAIDVASEAIPWAIVLGGLFALSTYLHRRQERLDWERRNNLPPIRTSAPRSLPPRNLRVIAPDVHTTSPYDWDGE